MNKMAEVAKLLGVEIGERFNIVGSRFNPYKIVERGLIDCDNKTSLHHMVKLITGQSEIEKIPFEPEHGYYFYFPVPNGEVLKNIWTDVKLDRRMRKNIGVYRTMEEAKAKGVELGWEMD